MDKFFRISERGSTVRREIIGGVTTFFTMAYILFVNPEILSGAVGTSQAAMASLFVATCIAAALGSILTGLMANVPFAQAPGMGLNAFFVVTIVGAMGYTWQEGFAIVFLSGIIFLAIAVSPLRKKIIAAIPMGLKAAIGAGVGLFIAFIGFNSALVSLGPPEPSLQWVINGAVNHGALLTLIGIIITAVLMARRVRGAIFIGILLTTLIGIPMGVTTLPTSFTTSDISLSYTFLQMDFAGAIPRHLTAVLPFATAMISLVIVEVFGVVGTLIGTADNAGMLDKDGNLPQGDRAIVADAIATLTGAAIGTSTVTTYIESAAGISEGAKTGLTPIVTGVLFLLAIVLAPLAGVIPAAATAPALIIVGVLMTKGATKIAWDDMEIAVPCFLTMVVMPFAYDITGGIAFGFISYCLIKLLRGKARQVSALAYGIAAFFLLMYVLNIVYAVSLQT